MPNAIEINVVLAERLNERMNALATNPTAVGKKAGLSASVVRNILEGKSKNPRSDTLEHLATALETTSSYLTGRSNLVTITNQENREIGAGHYRPPPKFFDSSKPMAVYSSAEGGDGALIISSEAIDWIPRPFVVANVETAYGVVIEGESMVRSYRPGDVAWVNPLLRERRDEDCIFRGFNNVTGEAKAVIKVLINWTAEEWTVEQLNPPKRYKLKRVEWPDCFRVVGSTKRP